MDEIIHYSCPTDFFVKRGQKILLIQRRKFLEPSSKIIINIYFYLFNI